jgi:hypothetical protein
MALATSPCFYKVKVKWSWRDSNGDDDFNLEATIELASGLALNLKEVVILNIEVWEQTRQWFLSRPRELWRGLPGFVRGKSIGSLTSLSIIGTLRAGRIFNELQAWAKHTDFGRLHHLTLGDGHETYCRKVCGETLKTIAQIFSFPQLKTLPVGINRYNSWEEKPHYADNAISFFKSLEPLDELSVPGSFKPKIVDAVLFRHGQTL